MSKTNFTRKYKKK